MAMVPPSPYDKLTNINRGMPQVAQPATTTQMRPSPPSLRGFMNQHHGHFGGSHFGMLPPGIDPRAIAANPQGYQQFLRQAQQQEQQRPGTTFLGQTPQPEMMPGLMPKSAGTGLDMFSNDQEKAKAAQYAAMMQYQQMQKTAGQQPEMKPGLSQQELQKKLSEQQLYGLGPNDQPMQPMQPANYGDRLTQPMQPMQPGMDFGLNQPSPQPGMQPSQYGGSPPMSLGKFQNTMQGTPSNPPMNLSGPMTQPLQPLQSNNLMQQVGMK
jgi:hypothetical protein